MKRISIALFLILLIGALCIGVACGVSAAEHPSFSVVSSNGHIFLETPGLVSLDFNITNNDTNGITIKSIDVNSIDGLPVQEGTQPSWSFDRWVAPGQSASLSRTLSFTENMIGKQITFRLEFTFDGSDASLFTYTSFTMYPFDAGLQLEYKVSNPVPLPNEEVTVYYTLTNPNPVDINVRIYDSQIITDSYGIPYYLDAGLIPALSSVTVEHKFTFSNEVTISPVALFACQLDDKSFNKRLEFESFTVSPENPQLELTLSSQSHTVVSGSQMYLQLTLKNVGNVAVSDISMQISSTDAVFNGITLAPNETIVKNVPVSITATTDFIATAQGTAVSGNPVQTHSSALRISTNISGDIDVTLEASPLLSLLPSAGDVTVNFVLTNNSEFAYTSVNLYEASRGLLLTLASVPIGSQTFSKAVNLTETEELVFTVEITGADGQIYTKSSAPFTIYIGSGTINPDVTQPPTTPVPSKQPVFSLGSLNLFWTPLLNLLSILVAVAGVAALLLLVYFIIVMIPRKNSYKAETTKSTPPAAHRSRRPKIKFKLKK